MPVPRGLGSTWNRDMAGTVLWLPGSAWTLVPRGTVLRSLCRIVIGIILYAPAYNLASMLFWAEDALLGGEFPFGPRRPFQTTNALLGHKQQPATACIAEPSLLIPYVFNGYDKPD